MIKIFKLGLLFALLYSCVTSNKKNSTYEFKQDLGKVSFTLDLPKNYSAFNDSLGEYWYMCGIRHDCFFSFQDSSYIAITPSSFNSKNNFPKFNEDYYKVWTVNSISDTLLSYQEYKMKDYYVSEYIFSNQRNSVNYLSLRSFITFNDLKIDIKSTYPNVQNKNSIIEEHRKIVSSLNIEVIDENALYKGISH